MVDGEKKHLGNGITEWVIYWVQMTKGAACLNIINLREMLNTS